MDNDEMSDPREVPLEMAPDEFRSAGHDLVDRIADFLAGLPERSVAPGESPTAVHALLGDGSLPDSGAPASHLLSEAAGLLFDHSLFNGHPRFWGYITSSAAPIGALADLLASSVNPNVGAWGLAPVATEIEGQTVRWIAELIGYPAACGGLLVSGGNMANFVALIAARRAKTPWNVRTDGMGTGERLRIYTSSETHTWVEKAADLFGLGTEAIRWIPADRDQRMDISELRSQIATDAEEGDIPFLVIGTAGSVSTGAVDPLPEIAATCREYGMWFHVDGAYGGLAAAVPGCPADLAGLSEADSVAVDPHKWLYAPLEAGCTLVRDPELLRDAFSFHPVYYHFDEETMAAINYYEYGPQNSRGFRALKVWLGLRQAGRQGYVQMLSDDIELAAMLFRKAGEHPELEAATNSLSITTFRYVPPDLQPGSEAVERYLNDLNTKLLERIQSGGEVFVSNAVVDGKYLLRACIVNFRTQRSDIEALPEVVVRLGRERDAALRPSHLDIAAGEG